MKLANVRNFWQESIRGRLIKVVSDSFLYRYVTEEKKKLVKLIQDFQTNFRLL